MPNYESLSFCVLDCNTGQIMMQKNCRRKIGLASLTKAMTLYTVLKLLEKFGLPPNGEKVNVKVSASAARIIGCTAGLKVNDTLTVE